MMKPLLDHGTTRWHMKVFDTVVNKPGELGEASTALRERIDAVDGGHRARWIMNLLTRFP